MWKYNTTSQRSMTWQHDCSNGNKKSVNSQKVNKNVAGKGLGFVLRAWICSLRSRRELINLNLCYKREVSKERTMPKSGKESVVYFDEDRFCSFNKSCVLELNTVTWDGYRWWVIQCHHGRILTDRREQQKFP